MVSRMEPAREVSTLSRARQGVFLFLSPSVHPAFCPSRFTLPSLMLFSSGEGGRFVLFFFLCVDNGKKKEPTCLTRPAHRGGAGEAHVCILYLVLERKAVGLQENAYLPSVSPNGCCFLFRFFLHRSEAKRTDQRGLCIGDSQTKHVCSVLPAFFDQTARAPARRRILPFVRRASQERAFFEPRDEASAYLPSMTPTRQCHVGLVGSIDVSAFIPG